MVCDQGHEKDTLVSALDHLIGPLGAVEMHPRDYEVFALSELMAS